MASTEENILTLLLSVEHMQHTAMEQQKAVADLSGCGKGNSGTQDMGYF